MTTPAAADVDLSGVIEMHIHSAPDVRPRCADDVAAVRSVAAAGMRAVVLKSHVTLTADRATIAQGVVGGDVRAFGGLVLNLAVGGFNPVAVEVALRLGAKEIWMPTVDAAHQRRTHGATGGLSPLTEEGGIRPEVREILALVRQADVILGTGHLGPEETAVLVREARGMGLRKILVTHPESPSVRMPTPVQKEIAVDGVFFERCYLNALPASGEQQPRVADIAAQVRAVGLASTILATDFGQAENPSPPEGMRAYLAGMLAEGFATADLRRMTADLPAYLLGL